MPKPNGGIGPATGTISDSFDWPVLRRRVLRGLAIAYGLSTIASFIESFSGLIDWFTYNGHGGVLAWIAPLMIDVVAVAGEAILLVAILEHWDWRARWAAGSATILMLAASVTGNVGRRGFPHLWYHHVPVIMANAAAPLALSGFTALGLVVVKRLFHPKDDDRTSGGGDVPGDLLVALEHFREYIFMGTLPSVREVRKVLSCGQDRADRIRVYCGELPPVLAAPSDGQDATEPAGAR